MKYNYLKIVAFGEAAVVGAGVGVALIGAMEIATAITAQQWLAQAKHYVDYAPLIGGMVGAITGASWIARRRQGAAAKIAEMSDHAVAQIRTELRGTLQITKLDEAIGADGKARPAQKPGADPMPPWPIPSQPPSEARTATPGPAH
jgi:hypothetical protein